MSSEAGQADHGRHRRAASGPGALPEPVARVGFRPAHARPVIIRPCDEPTVPLPAVPPIDPMIDTDAVGLRKFDIGTVPASVTPPRTWRRAAWFTVGSSVAALVALLVLGALLVGPSRMRTQIESFPGNPLQVPLPTTTDPSRQLPPGAPSAVAKTGAAGTGTRPDTPGSSSTGTHGSDAPTHTTQPTITTVTGVTSPVVDPGKVAQQTQHFFAAVTSNVGEAYQLTSGALKANGEAALQQRYQDVASVQVRGITIDPGRGITINTVLVTHRDGTTSTEEHVLAFTPGVLPLISQDTPVSG